MGNAKEKKLENQSYLFYLKIFHKNIATKRMSNIAKTNKIELLSKEMNLNHEIIYFQDIDNINNTILYMRMMLKNENIIKKYKIQELKLKELSLQNKEKKILSFPYNSKLTLNYILTNDKNTISNFIKDAQDNRNEKKAKSIFEQNEDDDDNCKEESENSDDAKNYDDSSNNTSHNASNNNIIKVEKKNNDDELKKNEFRKRLSLFDKAGQTQNNMNKPQQPPPNKININKFENMIKTNGNIKNNINNKITGSDNSNKNNAMIKNINENNIKKSENIKNENIQKAENKNKFNEILNKINKIENKNKNETNKKQQEPENEKEIFKKIENNNNQIKKETNPNKNSTKNENMKLNKIEPIKNNDINKTELVQKSNKLKNSEIKKNPFLKDDTDLKKDKTKSKLILNKKTIDLTNIFEDTTTFESFCNCFFICSFPYTNGKIMENSKNYKSLCNHAICCKLLAMEPEIIYKFPLEDEENVNNDFELNSLSASICFPIGIKICYNQDRRSIYKSFSTHIINKEGQKYYMTIYHFYRQLDSMTYNKLYSDDPLKIYLRKFGDNTYKNKAEKEQLEKDLEECQELAFREYAYVPYALALVSKYPYINQMRSCLNIIYKILTNHNEILNNLKNEEKKALLNKLLAYIIYGIPIPNINTEISFNMPLSLNKIKIQSPYKNNIRNLENVNFSYILSKFCPENIIKIYQLMLFENKLLFIDKDNNRLSTIITSFINILYPIDWVNTNIPIMSDQMTRYLQTFLPFVNGISEDLLLNSAEKALKEAEEGIFKINIMNDIIQYSKPNYEDDVLSSVPKLPNHIYKKLYSELSDLIEAYKLLTEKEKEKYMENINNIVKNIFLETVSIMLYDLMDYVINNEKGYNGFNPRSLIKMFGNEANFYKDLTETQNFQNFIQNFIKKKKDYSTFICMLKNVNEKYVKTSEKYKTNWKKTIRKLEKKDIQQIPMIFRIPLHLLNKEDSLITNYIIDKQEWNTINKTLKNATNNNDLLSNDIIQENERIAVIMNPIKIEDNIPNNKIERFYLPEEKQDNNLQDNSRMTMLPINNNSDKFEKLLKLNYVMANDYYIREESDITKEEQDKIKKSFKHIMAKILKNEIAPIDICLKNVYYSFGRDMLCKSMYQKGFKVVKKLKSESFNSLKKICINAFVSINNLEENQNILEFAVKITASAFCYCKEGQNIFLIDELRNNLGKDYSLWNKKTFWNTWQHLENYFSINDYGVYCQVIAHDFINKLLKLKLDKEFIENYLISTLAEKMILLEHSTQLSKETIKQNQALFMENRTTIMEFISISEY